MSLGDGAAIAVVDVGGTAIKHGLLDVDGELVDVGSVPAPPAGPAAAEGVVARIGELVAAAGTRSRVDRVSVALPGTVDAERGVGVLSENLEWRDVPFRELLEQQTGLPVDVLHDIQAASLAERHDGVLRGERDAAMLVIGTGIAAALVVDGVPLAARGYAGEIGHVVVEPGGPVCACGGTGCLEAVASAAAIARDLRARSGVEVDGAREVLALAQQGDEAAQASWDRAVRALARGIRVLQAVTAPEVIAIAGGLSAAGDALLVPLRDEVARVLTIQPAPRIVRAASGALAGLRGAAIHGRRA